MLNVDLVARDLARTKRLAKAYLRKQSTDPRWIAAERRANRALALEWAAIIVLSYALAYGPLPLGLKLVLTLPFGIASSLLVDNLLHAANHWPLFRSKRANTVWRWTAIFLYTVPLEVRHIHWDHHQTIDLDDDPQSALEAARSAGPGRQLWAMLRYLTKETLGSVRRAPPWSPLPACIEKLARGPKAAQRIEVIRMRWAGAVWLVALLILRPIETLCVLAPMLIVIGPLASYLMNLTDHAPAMLDHPFRQATYLEPEGRAERLYSAVNHHTAATHLTHHLCPQVHWVHLPRLQRRLGWTFRRHGAPRSLLVNSVVLGNPLALLSIARKLASEPTGLTRSWPAQVESPEGS